MNFSQKNEEASALPGLTFNIVSSIRSREARRSSRQKILLCTIIGKNDLNDFSVACPLLPLRLQAQQRLLCINQSFLSFLKVTSAADFLKSYALF